MARIIGQQKRGAQVVVEIKIQCARGDIRFGQTAAARINMFGGHCAVCKALGNDIAVKIIMKYRYNSIDFLKLALTQTIVSVFP